MPAELIGNVTYYDPIGGDVRQVKQPAIGARKQPYELDKASVNYDGAPSRIDSFVDGFASGDFMEWKDETGSGQSALFMFLDSANANDHPWQRETTLSYVGMFGDLPTPKIEDCLVSSNVTTTSTVTDPASPLYTEDGGGNPTTKLSGTVEYKSARTNISWYAFEEPDPDVPLYDSVSNTTPPLDRPFVLKMNTSNQPGLSVGTIDLADVIGLFNTLSAETHVDDYQIKPLIVGKIWQCSVCVQYVLVGV